MTSLKSIKGLLESHRQAAPVSSSIPGIISPLRSRLKANSNPSSQTIYSPHFKQRTGFSPLHQITAQNTLLSLPPTLLFGGERDLKPRLLIRVRGRLCIHLRPDRRCLGIFLRFG